MLNPFLMSQVKFVIGALKDKSQADRLEMFNEIRKHFCIHCGATMPCRAHEGK